jgi:hypothetical protein
MGLYSSWAALAVTNHFLVRLSGARRGFNEFEDYLVLGDDIVIFQEQVADEYIKLMESLGVETKPSDSIKPKVNHTFEIAKRLFRCGVEISPVPLSLVKTHFGLFALYMMDRQVLIDLKTLYPGNFAKASSLTAAALLMLWKVMPLWSYPGDYHGSKTLESALYRARALNPEILRTFGVTASSIETQSNIEPLEGSVVLPSLLLKAHTIFND